MKRREFTAAGAGMLTAALAGCSQLQEAIGQSPASDTHEGWTTFRGDHARTGYRPSADGPGESLSLDWEVTALELVEEVEGGDPDGYPILTKDLTSPVLVDGIIAWTMVYEWGRPRDRTVSFRAVAVDPETGEMQWSRELLDEEDAVAEAWFRLEVNDGELYAPTLFADEIGVTVFDPSTGDILRELDLGLSWWATELSVFEGTIIAAVSDDEKLFAFDAETGDSLWDAEVVTHPGMTFATIVDETLLYFDHGDDSLVARDVSDGTERFRESLELPEQFSANRPSTLAPPVVSDGSAYVAGDADVMFRRDIAPLVAVDADDGTERFRYDPPGIEGPNNPLNEINPGLDAPSEELPPFSTAYGLPVPVDELVVVTGFGDFSGTEEVDGHCFAVDDDGELAWALDSGIAYAPVATDEVVYLVSTEGVQAISAGGERLDTFVTQEETTASERVRMIPRIELSPALGEKRLFVPAYSGIIALS